MKTITGIVVSNKMEKTVKVQIDRLWMHPMYRKQIKRSKTLLAHTDKIIDLGTTVVIGETRPVSKNKTWKVIEIVAGGSKKVLEQTTKQAAQEEDKKLVEEKPSKPTLAETKKETVKKD
ncbi:30S ribosomal protein S17 [Candidatus Beckwithbacteria bacterium]|nr:30S ribosomal protein S17 [Candidatus Beckwithbacteria bacterium]